MTTPAAPLFKEPVTREMAMSPTAPPESPAAMFARLATDPNASVEKIERLMALWERSEARKAEGEFNSAMSDAQAETRPVAADAENPQTRSRYASYAALDRALRPIYTKHGFGLSFDTGESPLELHVRVLCYVTQRGGHARTYHVDMPADGKGAKGGDVMTRTHATGSAMSYGMRYLLKMIFNVAVGEDDDDGRAAAGRPGPKEPEGYAGWLIDLETVAEEGLKPLEAAWKKSKPEYREHLTKTTPATLNVLKAKAQKVGQ